MSEQPLTNPTAELIDALWELGKEKPHLREKIAACVLCVSNTQRSAAQTILSDGRQERAPSLLGARIKEMRTAHNMNQRAFADRAGVDPTMICKLENGRTQKINPADQAKILQLLTELETK